MKREQIVERGLSAVATTAHRLAVLLAAGAAPHSAWSYLDATTAPLVATMTLNPARLRL